MKQIDDTNNPFFYVFFYRQTHTYVAHGRRLESVTRLINDLKEPFDRDYWAAKKAEERGVSPQVIIDEWETKAQTSRDLGTRVHEHIEKVLKGTLTADDLFLSLNDTPPQIVAFDAFWNRASKMAKPVRPEWIIGDSSLGVGGTCDALLFNKETEKYHLWDWKTNSNFKTNNPFQTLKPPFDDLPDCELSVYSLQLSLYKLIIERNTDLEMGDSYILHLNDRAQFRIHVAEDYRERLEAWLKDRHDIK